jgi:uncharacterized protein
MNQIMAGKHAARFGRRPNISSDAQVAAISHQANSKPEEQTATGILRRFAGFLTTFQSILFLAHYLFFITLVHAFNPAGRSIAPSLGVLLAVLSIAFLSATLLGFRYKGLAVRLYYTLAAVWLGTFNYLFIAACAWWLIYGLTALAQIPVSPQILAAVLFGSALATSVYGLINANWIRVKRLPVRLPNLPQSWRGRSLALVSDLHLGHVHNAGFASRIVRLINQELPSAVIIAGDLFDGTAIDAARATAPFKDIHAIYGTFFSEGNHEEFHDPQPFLSAIAKAGVRVLDKEKVDLDGLQLIGLPYRDATHTRHMQSVLARLNIDRTRASVLICHAPDRPAVAEEAGISLQLSGHTHGGQFIPYSWIATRIYRQFTHGLSRIGNLQVFTSFGAGTWGPPLRVGTYPEIIILRLQ